MTFRKKIVIHFMLISLVAISMFFGNVKNTFANSHDLNKSIVINQQPTEIQQVIQKSNQDLEQDTSKILLENNEPIDNIVKSNELSIDTILDSQKESPLGQKKFSNKEIEMMAKMVYGEARGESLKGKIAVAAVILNRVESPKFPNTVSNVLFENGAFTAVSDGQYQKMPNYDAYHAVYLAIKGMDPTKNAVFYYNPKIATSDWIFSRQKTVKIGDHVFAK